MVHDDNERGGGHHPKLLLNNILTNPVARTLFSSKRSVGYVRAQKRLETL